LRLTTALKVTLDSFGEKRRGAPSSDPGPLVLAALAARRSGAAIDQRIVEVWLDALDRAAQTGAIAFGPMCPMSGLAAARSVAPRLGRLNRQVWDDVARIWPRDRWRTRDIAWDDYDLIAGPAGMLLNLVAAGVLRSPLVGRCIRQLLALCADEELASFRPGAGRGGDHNRWNEGRINTSLAHGVAGVALALKAALEHRLSPVRTLRAALARVSDWLVSQSFVDRRGLRTWAPGSLDGRDPPAPQRRQAWCYGTPGIAWSLWESGRVLDRKDLRDFARDAMATFCERFEPGLYLDSEPIARFGFCHGAAGTLAVADCFGRHARSRAAAALAASLDRLLCAHLGQIVPLAPADSSLLEGAPGVLSVLLTRRGAPRDWLIPFGLR
jgi:hypothetical protein